MVWFLSFLPPFRGASEHVTLSAAGAKDLLFGFADTQMYQRILRSRACRALAQEDRKSVV